MKKGTILTALILFTIFFQNCKSTYIPEFIFPESLSEDERLDYEELGMSGYVHYKQFCGGCHGITHKGQSAIPNFTKEALDDYNLRFQMNREPIHGKLDELTDNHLDAIITFLEFRKKEPIK
ncbi:MAG: hypothetical protein COA58_14785 [Bacteroidetes bacterium]|nr:MAG: hypothetical protein COA58_14785 [Bacteroidota bacterium]